MKKALVLMSGGLDSSLAAWLIKKQEIGVKALIFKSYFFGPEKGVEAAKQLQIPYQIIDFSKEHLKIVKRPKYGYGKAINPCLDCHLLMLKTAKKFLSRGEADFIVTGEVLGQRPFSQNKQALLKIEKQSGLKGKLLRPLSAKLLSPTLAEEKSWVDREKLWEIEGRSRKRQIAEARKIGLTFPQPAGGCLLTEIEFGKKLKDFLHKKANFNEKDAQVLKLGRHFWLGKNQVVIGKNQEENNQLKTMAEARDTLVQPANFIGPLALIRGPKIENQTIQKVRKMIISYSKNPQQIKLKPIIFFGSSKESVIVLKTILKEKVPVSLVVTRPDRPAGRGQKVTPNPLAKFATTLKIPVLKREKLDQEGLEKTEKILGEKPILAITAAYGNFIPQDWLNWCRMVINLHPSLLPRWRGAAPVVRAIENGDQTSGITILGTVKEMDAGPIIKQSKTKIMNRETAGQLTERLFNLGVKKLIESLRLNLFVQKPSFWLMKPQNNQRVTLAKKIEKGEAAIDWHHPPEEILNQIRAFNPWPGAYTWARGGNKKLRLKIWQARIENNQLIPEEVQIEGKNKTQWNQVKNNLFIVK